MTNAIILVLALLLPVAFVAGARINTARWRHVNRVLTAGQEAWDEEIAELSEHLGELHRSHLVEQNKIRGMMHERVKQADAEARRADRRAKLWQERYCTMENKAKFLERRVKILRSRLRANDLPTDE